MLLKSALLLTLTPAIFAAAVPTRNQNESQEEPQTFRRTIFALGPEVKDSEAVLSILASNGVVDAEGDWASTTDVNYLVTFGLG